MKIKIGLKYAIVHFIIHSQMEPWMLVNEDVQDDYCMLLSFKCKHDINWTAASEVLKLPSNIKPSLDDFLENDQV